MPDIYVLRKNTEPLPSREKCGPGDCVIMPSGDVLVYTGGSWDLLPGRYASIEQLKEFIGYVASGWPDTPQIARMDMEGKVPEEFLGRMISTVERINSYNQTLNG